MGFTVTITGGVTPADLATFARHPVGIVIAGRSIVAAEDPLVAAADLKQAIARVWPS
jgi:3-dehydro-L-gulonate-6-phosphate decarboxylase